MTLALSDRPLTLSVAMIVRDVALELPDTLDSFRSIADEFVVLDTGSKDDTIRVAREAGASVFEFAWCDDFAAARNECARHVSGEWTLWVDAGETIDNLAAAQLRQFVEGEASLSKAYVLYVQKPVAAHDCYAEQIGQLRLLPTASRLTFLGRIRETALPAAIAAGLEIDALDCRILRPQEDLDPQTRQSKARRDLRLAELSVAECGPSAQLLNVQAQALAELDRSSEAHPLFRRAVDAAPDGSTEMLEAYYGLLSTLDRLEAAMELRTATCLEALEVFPLDAQLLCGMGCYLFQEGHLELAARSYELAALHGQVDPATWHLADLAEVAVACQSLLCQQLGRGDDARRALQAALRNHPERVSLRRQLIDLHIQQADERAALDELNRLHDCVPDGEAVEIVRGAILLCSGNLSAGLARLQSVYERGCRNALCFRWLTTACIRSGDAATAQRLLDQWQQVEGAAAEVGRFRVALEALPSGRKGRTPSIVAPQPPHGTLHPPHPAPRPWVPAPERWRAVSEPGAAATDPTNS